MAARPTSPFLTAMSAFPLCPQCHSEYTYEDGDNYVCPECAHD